MRGACVLGIAIAWSTGCSEGSSDAAVDAAEARLEEARALGAETSAPFEYYEGRARLRDALLEPHSPRRARRAAESAELYARQAIDRAKPSGATAPDGGP